MPKTLSRLMEKGQNAQLYFARDTRQDMEEPKKSVIGTPPLGPKKGNGEISCHEMEKKSIFRYTPLMIALREILNCVQDQDLFRSLYSLRIDLKSKTRTNNANSTVTIGKTPMTILRLNRKSGPSFGGDI